jgi:hypothetical protein
MINFSFTISLPFGNIDYKDYFVKDMSITKNKNLEVQVGCGGDTLIGAHLTVTMPKKDHSGFYIGVDFLGHFVGITLYDRRHWDAEAQRWEKPQ